MHLICYWEVGGKYAVLVRHVNSGYDVAPRWRHWHGPYNHMKGGISTTIVKIKPHALVTAAITGEFSVSSVRDKNIEVMEEFGRVPRAPKRKFARHHASMGTGSTKGPKYVRWETWFNAMLQDARMHVHKLNEEEKLNEAQGLRPEAGTGAS